MKVTNELLAGLLIAAVLITVVGTIVNSFRITQLYKSITGYAVNETGYVEVNVSSNVSITLPQNTVDFGSGYLKSGASYVDLQSNDTTVPSNWENTSIYDPSDLILENNGNTNVSVTVTSNVTADEFIGGDDPQFKFAAENNESNSCVGTLQSSYTELTTTAQNVCTNLGAISSANSLKIHILLRVSVGASTTGKEVAALTFSASQA